MQFSTSSAAGRWQRASCLVVVAAVAMLLAGNAYGSIAFTNVNPDVVATMSTNGAQYPSSWTYSPCTVTIGQSVYRIGHGASQMGPGSWDISASVSGSVVSDLVDMNGGYNDVNVATILPAGAIIDGSQRFTEGAKLYYTTPYGPYIDTWHNVSSQFMGLKLDMADGIHYGWMQVSSNRHVVDYPITIEAFAYERIPNQSIVAGAIPEPASLTLLGVGALVGLRRRRA